MLLRNTNFQNHLPWLAASIIVLILAVVWFVFASIGQSAWPSGSSTPGFTFGVVGGLICLFEFLIWPRKKLRSWRLGKLTLWMRAHIWLGVLAVPLLVLHTGFRWGGCLSTTLMVLFLVVVASGIWGLALQQFLPSLLLRDVPSETIYSQIGVVSGLLVQEADTLVKKACGFADTENSIPEDRVDDHGLVVGALRTSGAIQARVSISPSLQETLLNSKPLWDFHNEHLRKFLAAGNHEPSELADKNRSRAMFNSLRLKLEPKAHDLVTVLEDLCNQRRQLILQSKIHFWLHNWLWVHLPLSVALIVLMFVHIFVALKYW